MKPIIRICPPSRYDKAPLGAICYVKGENKLDGYIQLNDDESRPQWMPVGEFLWAVFKDSLDDKDFIEECLAHYYESKA